MPLDYEQLARFKQCRCVAPEHERAVKRAVWNLTLGLEHTVHGARRSSLLFQVLQSSTTRMTIWSFMGLDLEVDLPLTNVRPATSDADECYGLSVAHLIAGFQPWVTDYIANRKVESVVLSVAAESRVTSLAIASFKVVDAALFNARQMRVDEVAADGTVGRTLAPWQHYGYRSRRSEDMYAPAVIEAPAGMAATRFKVSVRQISGEEYNAGVAIFRVRGVRPPLLCSE